MIGARHRRLALVGLLLTAAPAPVAAQDFGDCLAEPGRFLAETEQAVADRPAGWFGDPRRALTDAYQCALVHAENEVVPEVRGWFLGLTIVLVVWTGIQIQFGWFDIGRLVSVVMLLGFAWFVFENYYSPTSVLGGNNRGFAHFIVQGGQVIGDDLIASADDVFLEAVRAARRDLNTETRTADSIFSSRAAGVAFAATVLAGAGVGAGAGGKVGAGAGTFVGGPVGTLVGAVGGAVAGGVTGAALAAWSAWQVSEDWFAYQMRIFMVTAMKWTGLLAMWLIYWMIMAQYLWGMASLSLLSLIGPIFIPFILLPQSDWLFWGWLKALIQATFHMITSAALYAVVAVVLVTPLERLRHLPLPADPGGAAGVAEFSLSLLLGGFPTLVMSFLAALQVGSLSGALLSGGALPGAGLAGRVGQVLAGARAATSRFIPRPAQISDEAGLAIEAAKRRAGATGAAAGGAGSAAGWTGSTVAQRTARELASTRALRQMYRQAGQASSAEQELAVYRQWGERIGRFQRLEHKALAEGRDPFSVGRRKL